MEEIRYAAYNVENLSIPEYNLGSAELVIKIPYKTGIDELFSNLSALSLGFASRYDKGECERDYYAIFSYKSGSDTLQEHEVVFQYPHTLADYLIYTYAKEDTDIKDNPSFKSRYPEGCLNDDNDAFVSKKLDDTMKGFIVEHKKILIYANKIIAIFAKEADNDLIITVNGLNIAIENSHMEKYLKSIMNMLGVIFNDCKCNISYVDIQAERIARYDANKLRASMGLSDEQVEQSILEASSVDEDVNLISDIGRIMEIIDSFIKTAYAKSFEKDCYNK